MHFILLAVVLCVALAVAASAIACYGRRCDRRRERERAEWARLAPHLRGLDEELDRIWAAGQGSRR